MLQSVPGAPREDASKSALQMVSLLHQLTMEAVLSENLQELGFRILNRTVAFSPYDRAVLFSFQKRSPAVLGVSGQSTLPKNSELVSRWGQLARGLKNPREAAVLGAGSFDPGVEDAWHALTQTGAHPNILWLPVFSRQKMVGGLWLERWQEKPWHERDIKLLKSLMVSYGVIWEVLSPPPNVFLRLLGLTRRKFFAVLAVLALALVLVRLPLRVVAPCEVIPKDPVVVTAPINGVVAEMVAQPGRQVAAGELLFKYDKKVALEELNVARQQVQIIQSSLNRASVQAFSDAKARAEIALLELKLEQERSRMRVAEYNASRLDVFTENEGRVVIDDPSEWRGKPVVVGQKVLMIVDPHKNKVRIWLPVDDNIVFDSSRAVNVHLNAFPEKSLEASLDFVSDNVSANPDGVPSVLAEADWTGQPAELKTGLQGTATLYGGRVSLGYWLLRKPMGWLRKTFAL